MKPTSDPNKGAASKNITKRIQELRDWRGEILGYVRQKVSWLKRQGKSLAELLAAKPISDYDAKWGQFVIDGNFFTRLVYVGI